MGSLLLVIASLLGMARSAAAQRLVEVAPAALHRAAAISHAGRGSAPLRSRSTASGRKQWPWYMLGGAVVGGAGAGGFMVRHCDAGCRDDGGFAMLPPIVLGGAAGGAILGAVVGRTFDFARTGK